MKIPLILLAAAIAGAQTVNIQTISYRVDTASFEGKLVTPKSVKGNLPGIVLMPDWMGVTPQAMTYAKKVADWGYVVLIADLYGKNRQPQSPKEAGMLSGYLKQNVLVLRKRGEAALNALKQQPGVETTKIAAMGFCFGGAAALELGRAGATLNGIVSIHGNLNTPLPQDSKNIHGKVLILQGAEDPYATPAQAQAFMDEMRQAGTDWQLIYYGGAVHGFTNPQSGDDPKKGLAYNARADRRAFALVKDFFGEAL